MDVIQEVNEPLECSDGCNCDMNHQPCLHPEFLIDAWISSKVCFFVLILVWLGTMSTMSGMDVASIEGEPF